MEYITLSNGIRMSILGYGVYQVSHEECEHCVLERSKIFITKARYGISNFYFDRIIDIASFTRIKPMINRIEVYPHH